VLGEQLVVPRCETLEGRRVLRRADVAESDRRVSPQPPWVVSRHVQAVEGLDERAAVRLKPRDQVDVPVTGRVIRASFLDAAVPRADVLADVAAVHLSAELPAVVHRDRRRRLAPVREAARSVQRPRLVERVRRARVDAKRARAAACGERRRRIELPVADQRPENDPGPVAARDQHRVLAVEPHPAPRGGLAIDMLVRVDEHAVLAAEHAPDRIELLAQLRIGVFPRVARQAPLPRGKRRLGSPVAERGRDDAARTRQQRFRMARLLGARHREPHVREQAARTALPDVPLGLLVGLGAGDPDRVQAELLAQAADVLRSHARIVPA
jgi:hypothetical protein